jgi:hypothetical protein
MTMSNSKLARAERALDKSAAVVLAGLGIVLAVSFSLLGA